MHGLVAKSNASLAASVLSLSGEKDGLCLCCLEPNSVVLRPPQASLGASLEFRRHIVKVNTLRNPGDIVDKGDTSAVLHLALNCMVDLSNIQSKEHW